MARNTPFAIRSKRASGFALLSAIGATFILAVLAIALTTLSIYSVRMSGHRQVSIEAFDAAEAGFRHAAKSISENQNYTGQQNTTFGVGRFSVAVSTPVGQPNQRFVTSTGTVVGSQGRTVTKRVTGMILIEEETEAGTDYAILADKMLEFSGNAIVNSSPNPNEGHIHSNGTLKISGNPMIQGEGSVVGKYEKSGSPTYTGGLHTAAAPVTVPWPDFAGFKTQAYATGPIHNGDRVINGSSSVTLKGVITGKLEIKDGAKVTVDGPVWVLGEAILQGNTQIKGDGAIVCEKKMVLGGTGGFTNDPSIDNSLLLASMYGPDSTVAMDINGKVKVKAGIFAKNGKINLSGEMDIWGFLRASTVYVSGQADVIKNTNYSPFYVEPTITTDVQYWQES